MFLALAGEIIEALKECGLVDFCSFPYEGYYEEDVDELYLMARVQGAGQGLEISCRVALEMEKEELFALNWLGTRDVAEAIRLVRINEVYFNKLGKKRDQQVAADKGKGKIMPDVEREREEQTDPVKGILPKFTEKRENENEAGINEVLRVLVDSQNQLKNELERTSNMQQYFKFRKLRSEYERLVIRTKTRQLSR
nr:uncharacterized protein LOC109192376 [Ipomoea trifida]